MARRRILIVGYPKSGNTWLTRLAAELLDAPVRGFWREPHTQEIAVEGVERKARIDVFKGHHAWRAVSGEAALENVVYVVRDVRDVAISGAHYFSFKRRTIVGRVESGFRSIGRRISPRLELEYRVRRMISVLAEGDAGVSPWCAEPWDDHVTAYLAGGAFVVRYEDLLYCPEDEARRLLRHLGVHRTTAQIDAAVRRQAFAVAKARYLQAGDHARAALLRNGRAADWRTLLSAEQRAFCWQRFGVSLATLGYGVDGIARRAPDTRRPGPPALENVRSDRVTFGYNRA